MNTFKQSKEVPLESLNRRDNQFSCCGCLRTKASVSARDKIRRSSMATRLRQPSFPQISTVVWRVNSRWFQSDPMSDLTNLRKKTLCFLDLKMPLGNTEEYVFIRQCSKERLMDVVCKYRAYVFVIYYSRFNK